jgi:hypothetical protein
MRRDLFASRCILDSIGLHRLDAFLQPQIARAESLYLSVLAKDFVAEFLQCALEVGQTDLQFLDALFGRHGVAFGSGNSRATTARSSWASTL